jgi:hypothetical protein
MKEKDAFDQWWQWAEKPVDSVLMIPTELHDAVMAMSPDDRRDRGTLKVNRIDRRINRCMLLIAALAVIWNLLAR